MKTKNKHQRSIHLHMEYFFRKRYCLIAVLGLLAFAVLKGDTKMFGMMREAYAQGFGMVGQFMREETTRVPVTYETVGRAPTVSGN